MNKLRFAALCPEIQLDIRYFMRASEEQVRASTCSRSLARVARRGVRGPVSRCSADDEASRADGPQHEAADRLRPARRRRGARARLAQAPRLRDRQRRPGARAHRLGDDRRGAAGQHALPADRPAHRTGAPLGDFVVQLFRGIEQQREVRTPATQIPRWAVGRRSRASASVRGRSGPVGRYSRSARPPRGPTPTTPSTPP